jgi:hypothetical protein
MPTELIDGQILAESFLASLPARGPTKEANLGTFSRNGRINPQDIDFDILLKLPNIFFPNDLIGHDYLKLFKGDLSAYAGDHSAADLALCAHMAREGLAPDQADLVFRSSGLYRAKWDEMRGPVTYGQLTISKAFEPYISKGTLPSASPPATGSWWDLNGLGRYQPNYVASNMPARRFVGPSVTAGVRLFPVAALSTLVALGAVGKTSLLVSIAAHVAAGRQWNGFGLSQSKVAMFFCEETQDELDRKISAIIDKWTPAEQQDVRDHLLLVSLIGKDVRLTTIERGQYSGTGAAEKMIAMLHAFGLRDGLVILDHMQGFASGDLNISETATSICREANKIVEATGSAVVFAAHIAKANIGATELSQGFAVGSLAFENATRQMVGLLPMPEQNAKEYGVELTRNEYVWLGLPKNSYGSNDGGVWLHKEVVKKYHTVVVHPVQLIKPIPGLKKSANEKLAERIIDYLTQHPWTTRNQLDGLSGVNEVLKASKQKVRVVLGGLMDTGVIEIRQVTDAERAKNHLPKQVKVVLTVANPVKAADSPADLPKTKNSSAGLKPKLDAP